MSIRRAWLWMQSRPKNYRTQQKHIPILVQHAPSFAPPTLLSLVLTIAGISILLPGCGSNPAPEPSSAPPSDSALPAEQTVTLHIPDMAEQLDIM